MTLREGSWLRSKITLIFAGAILLVALVFIVLHEGKTSILIPIYGIANEYTVDAISKSLSACPFVKVTYHVVTGDGGRGGTVAYLIKAPWWMLNSLEDRLRAEPFVWEGF